MITRNENLTARRAPDRFNPFLISLVLIVIIFIAYEPMRHNAFVEYDDSLYITENPNVRGGLSLDSIVWAFTQPHDYMWHPLTTLSHLIDWQIFGANPIGHHFVSLLFHIANALMLFWILAHSTKSIWASAFAAAVFALHPLQVESVAWAAERKTVLSGFFWFLTIIFYLKYAEKPDFKRYAALFGIFVLCVMTKPIVVTLPFVLLLMDYWPLDRVRFEKNQWRILYRLVLEKIPLFFLSGILCVITFFAQRNSSAMASADELPAAIRIANVFISYLKYIGKIFWPENLAVLYPYPYKTVPVRAAVISLLLLLAITLYFVQSAKKQKYLLAGWLWYLVILIPVIGIVQVGAQAIADRYTYLPAIGIFIITAWGISEINDKFQLKKMWLAISAGLILTVLLICTRTQISYWQNTLTLYKHTAEVTENNFFMHILYGNALRQNNELGKAAAEYNEAIRINQHSADAYNGIGLIYLQIGKNDLALANFTKGVELNPDSPEALNNLAWLIITTDNISPEDVNKAIEYSEKACRLTNYDSPQCLDTLATVYAGAGRFDDAVKTADMAVNIAKAKGMDSIVNEIQGRKELFQSRKTYRRR